jgi:hypothetical protein
VTRPSVRRAALPLVLLAVLAPLAACAGASAKPGTFRPEGSAATAGTSRAASPALAAFPFPADLHVVFQTPLPADRRLAAAVLADEDYQLAYYYSLSTRGRDTSYARYASVLPPAGLSPAGAAVAISLFAFTKHDIARQVARHETRTGTIRFFAASVAHDFGKSVDFRYCVDESKLSYLNTRTGRVTPSTHPYYLEDDAIGQQAGTVWQVTYTFTYYPPNQFAEECRP